MSDENQQVVEEPQATEENVAPTEVEGTPPAEEQVEAKTFTQEELDAIVQKRISKLERKLERQKIEAETREQVRTEQRPEPQGKPKQDDFTSYDDYIEALTDWKAEKAINDRQERESRAEAERREKAAIERRNERQQGLLEAGENKYTDFEEVVKSDKTEYSQAAYLAILESDQGADIVYHLAKNQDEAKRIAQLPAYAQAKEIGKLEDKLSAKKPAKASNAPAPVNPLGGGQSPSKDLANMSMDEYVAHRAKSNPVWARR